MSNWFTLDTIDNDTFILSEYRHWEETHCYLLCGADRALLIVKPTIQLARRQ